MVVAAMANCRELMCSAVALLPLLSTMFGATVCHGHATDVLAAGPAPNAIFVFGDSYLDTGNHNKTAYVVNRPWLVPYGMTYPGQPAGRFSDGRVFADVFAEILGLPSPVPYEQRLNDPNAPKYGINFAVGGAGVFNPYGVLSLRGQVDQFESLTNTVYPKEFLANSVVLVGIHGNDYGAYLSGGNPFSGIVMLEKLVINEMALQIERLYELGFRSFYVDNIEPMGCLPSATRPSFRACNETTNIISVQHNGILVTAVADLKNRLPGSSFSILELFAAFNTVLQNPAKFGISADPLVPCCMGAGNASRSCAEYDISGKPLFTVCADPSKAFLWDINHPTQTGWTAVARVLFPTATLIKLP